MMEVIDGKVLYVDIDNTLIFSPNETKDVTDIEAVEINHRVWYLHVHHIEFIKDCAARGINIIAWSGGGAVWTQTVVKKAGLEGVVAVCMAKPDWVLDDKTIDTWLGEGKRIYFDTTGKPVKQSGEEY